MIKNDVKNFLLCIMMTLSAWPVLGGNREAVSEKAEKKELVPIRAGAAAAQPKEERRLDTMPQELLVKMMTPLVGEPFLPAYEGPDGRVLPVYTQQQRTLVVPLMETSRALYRAADGFPGRWMERLSSNDFLARWARDSLSQNPLHCYEVVLHEIDFEALKNQVAGTDAAKKIVSVILTESWLDGSAEALKAHLPFLQRTCWHSCLTVEKMQDFFSEVNAQARARVGDTKVEVIVHGQATLDIFFATYNTLSEQNQRSIHTLTCDRWAGTQLNLMHLPYLQEVRGWFSLLPVENHPALRVIGSAHIGVEKTVAAPWVSVVTSCPNLREVFSDKKTLETPGAGIGGFDVCFQDCPRLETLNLSLANWVIGLTLEGCPNTKLFIREAPVSLFLGEVLSFDLAEHMKACVLTVESQEEMQAWAARLAAQPASVQKAFSTVQCNFPVQIDLARLSHISTARESLALRDGERE